MTILFLGVGWVGRELTRRGCTASHACRGDPAAGLLCACMITDAVRPPTALAPTLVILGACSFSSFDFHVGGAEHPYEGSVDGGWALGGAPVLRQRVCPYYEAPTAAPVRCSVLQTSWLILSCLFAFLGGGQAASLPINGDMTIERTTQTSISLAVMADNVASLHTTVATIDMNMANNLVTVSVSPPHCGVCFSPVFIVLRPGLRQGRHPWSVGGAIRHWHSHWMAGTAWCHCAAGPVADSCVVPGAPRALSPPTHLSLSGCHG